MESKSEEDLILPPAILYTMENTVYASWKNLLGKVNQRISTQNKKIRLLAEKYKLRIDKLTNENIMMRKMIESNTTIIEYLYGENSYS